MENIFKGHNGFAGKAARAVEHYSSLAAFGDGHTPEKESKRRGKQKFAEALSLQEMISNRLLTALPGENFARLVPFLEPAFIPSGSNYWASNGSAQFIYFPEDSVISCLSATQDGSTVEVGLIGRDGVVGLAAILGFDSSMLCTQTAVAGSALRINTKALKEEFDRNGKIRQLLLSYTCEYINQISQRAVCNVRHRVEERLASWLIMIHDRLDTDDLLFTHEQIAQHLGTRRAGVTDAANDLRNHQVISYNRGHIHILNRRALEDHACECYRMLRMHVS